MKYALGAVALLIAGAAVAMPFHEIPAGPRALPGDRLPPFAMLTDGGELPLDPPPLPPGTHLPAPGDPPESTAPAPSLKQATRMAQAALDDCTRRGFRVGVAVGDSAGEARGMLTADGADGSHVFVAMRKAAVALAFGSTSGEAHEALRHDPALKAKVTPAMFVEGGAVPIHANGRIIGAIAVSGAAGIPVGHQDEVCAAAGLKL
mgnify:CR=1 FL=1